MESRFGVQALPEYGLATCQIEKSMTTMRDAIFCYLADPKLFLQRKRTLQSEFWSTRFCGWENYYTNISRLEAEKHRSFVKFAIIRDPVDRFLSGFVDKCLQEPDQFAREFRCLGCAEDLLCFAERLFHLLYRMALKREHIEREVWYVARHFAPQTWYCDFKTHLTDYTIIKHHPGANNTQLLAVSLDGILERVKVSPKNRRFIHKEITSKRIPEKLSVFPAIVKPPSSMGEILFRGQNSARQ
ncbi:unnamed protein product [Heligmosomoides polygyrus]|uniref:Sulfotransfer_1 domain-containing protein n=1 Tax=Heligmosomoides polygyrus TaxID=6339 RepID=A0A183FGI4_HELPZ|nr:unnamed protein product [Heligmosomoides polygyrus]